MMVFISPSAIRSVRETFSEGEKYRSKPFAKLAFSNYLSRIENPKSSRDWLTRDDDIITKYRNDEYCRFIFTVSAACIFTPDEEYSLSERRYLAKLPEISKETITSGEFMKGFDEYAADQFPMRDDLRGVKAFFSTKLLGKADNNGLFFKNGHISKIDTAENDYMTDYSARLFKKIIDSNIAGKNANIYY